MPAFRDLTGQKFGKLTVLGRAPNVGRRIMFHVHCACCGNEKIIRVDGLTSGVVQSCGIRKSELFMQRATKHGHARDGKTSPEY